MDVERLLDSSPLSIQCPRCGHAEEDDYEVIPHDSVQPMRCPKCSSVFHLAVAECTACGAEALRVWRRKPAENETSDLRCPACGRRYVDHEATAAFDE